MQNKCYRVLGKSITFIGLMFIYVLFFAVSFGMVGFAFFQFDFKREKFYEESFREMRVKYNVSLAQLKNDTNEDQEYVKGKTFSAYNQTGYWYSKFIKDAKDDFGYFNYGDAFIFMLKYWVGMVPEQATLPQEGDWVSEPNVKAVFVVLNFVMPLVLITVMLNYLIAIMSAAQ